MKINIKVLPLIVCFSMAYMSNISISAVSMGDTNSDNSINILDVLNIKHGVLYGTTVENSDFSHNGIADAQDYLSLKKVALGIDATVPVDESLGKYVLTSSLNFREFAGTEYSSYGIVDKYTPIDIVETTYSTDGVLWGKYFYNGKFGWSSLKYASKLQKVDTTSKGFDIYQGEGLTFVDNLLVVNKTYSLPSTYAPIDATITKDTNSAFSKMKSDASKLGLNLYISSGYRSYEYQKGLYQRYVNRDGKAKADTYSARAGHSEHQTGLCFDLNTISDSFANTKEGIWVAKNCYKYGFIIRYPKGKDSITGYKYEPWHLRYVGVDLATTLHDTNLTLEEYFGITSKYN